MRIEEVSKKFDIPKSQIRYYEKIGLLYVPRDLNDYRNFDERSIIDLKMIIDLKSLDIDLSDIKYILELFHKTTNRTCNANSTEYIDKVIQKKE
ncbi:MerR family transcriptional regulator [Staphylococcus pettenkoferi]|uniref:MerR family transcriptional regulator n=2 Tax=Staphylococcus TaxID=1279 RepID=UPI0022750C91|nr:MerR family transcriptional regulator [Staphylococcus pettenkoferi]MCY1604506.1 MerR family transcriptional regulator [Staphylococcus pettenkoferi]